MISTRKHTVSDRRSQSDRSVARLRSDRGSAEITFVELPIAVGFGSPVQVRPRRLTAVPGLPVDFVGAPASRRPGRVIALPGGAADLDGAHQLTGPTVGRPSSPALLDSPQWGRSHPGESAPLRLTARGRAVLLVVAATIGLAVIVAAWFGASSTAPPARSAPPAQVVVHNGDTLWSIASRVAPGRDPRAVVDQLLRINRLDTPALVPGQVLRTH